MTNKEFMANTGEADPTMVSDFEGQVIVTIFYDGRHHPYGADALRLLRQTLSTFGNVKAIHSLAPMQDHLREFRVEYYDTRAAQNAVASLKGAVIGVSTIPPSTVIH